MKLNATVVSVDSAALHSDGLPRVTLRFKEGDFMCRDLKIPNNGTFLFWLDQTITVDFDVPAKEDYPLQRAKSETKSESE
jgi:hypothetical protein